ncbi:Arylesterase [Ostertagia ostertagi]
MVFDWNRNNPLQLALVRIIEDEKFIRPNDLAAIDENSFILTNDGYAQTELLSFLEILTVYPSGSVTSSYLISRSISPNGIILNKERTHVIISHVNIETISVYKLNNNNHTLSHVVDVPTLTSADNFCLDKSGAVWTGAHPVLKDAVGLLSDCDNVEVHLKAPSQVLRIVFSKDFKSWEITEPFADDGSLISASSIAAPYGNQLLIGSVCRELVLCDISPETI